MNETDKQEVVIAPGVAESIVAVAASQVDGVAYLGSKTYQTNKSVLDIFFKKPSSSNTGVLILEEDGELMVNLNLKLFYGYKLQEVAANIRVAVFDALLSQACIRIDRVNITVDGIVFKV